MASTANKVLSVTGAGDVRNLGDNDCLKGAYRPSVGRKTSAARTCLYAVQYLVSAVSFR